MRVPFQALPDFAATFVHGLPVARAARAHVVGLSGDLGSGKTAFVQQVTRVLGYAGTVTSPTFVIAQRYPIAHPVFAYLIHIDAYRLVQEQAHTIGWNEYCNDPTNLVLVEWPEQLGAAFPDDAPILKFEVINEDTREINYVER